MPNVLTLMHIITATKVLNFCKIKTGGVIKYVNILISTAFWR